MHFSLLRLQDLVFIQCQICDAIIVMVGHQSSIKISFWNNDLYLRMVFFQPFDNQKSIRFLLLLNWEKYMNNFHAGKVQYSKLFKQLNTKCMNLFGR
ncbi:hypothetical protein D3C71_1792460 [compost metagenome]